MSIQRFEKCEKFLIIWHWILDLWELKIALLVFKINDHKKSNDIASKWQGQMCHHNNWVQFFTFISRQMFNFKKMTFFHEKIVHLPWGWVFLSSSKIERYLCQFQALRFNNNGRTLIDLGSPSFYYKGNRMEYPMERKINVWNLPRFEMYRKSLFLL